MTRPLHARSSLALLLALAAPFLLTLRAQTPATTTPLRFDVSTVRPHRSEGSDPSNRRVLPGGRFVATATTVQTLLRVAFGTDSSLLTGAPGWVADKTFDITATTVNHADITTPQQFQQAILSLLEDRFQLKFHREQVQGSVYWLEMDKPGKAGRGLKPSTAPETNMSSNSNGSNVTMKVSKMSMAEIATALRRPAARPVEDHTGLPGNFDFQIEWAAQETPDSTSPSLFTVLKEELGLKLRPAKGTVEHIVIDKIAEPSEN